MRAEDCPDEYEDCPDEYEILAFDKKEFACDEPPDYSHIENSVKPFIPKSRKFAAIASY